MSDSAVQLRDVKWTPTRITFVGLLFVSGSLHFVLAATTERHVFSLVALGLLAGFVLFVTQEWQSVFYLVAAVFAIAGTTIWYYLGTPLPRVGLLDAAVQSLLAVVSMGLYVSNRLD